MPGAMGGLASGESVAEAFPSTSITSAAAPQLGPGAFSDSVGVAPSSIPNRIKCRCAGGMPKGVEDAPRAAHPNPCV